MEVRIRHKPAGAVARVLLAPGESLHAITEAMLACGFGVSQAPVESLPRNGQHGQRRQTAGRECVFTAPAEGGWVDLAPSWVGDLHIVEFDGTSGWCIARNAFVAGATTVRVDRRWPGFSELFGGRSGFLAHYAGVGPALIAASGAVDIFELKAGEAITIQPGFVLAYRDVVPARLRALDPAAPQSLRTGAGLLLDLAGPGTVVAQTRTRPG